MSTSPEPAGEVAVIEVAELTVKLVALVVPNFTAVAPVRFVPVIVTAVPPGAGPDVGEIDVTAGRHDVSELVRGQRRRRAAGRRHADIDGACAGWRGGRDLRGGIDSEAGCSRGAKGHGCCAGKSACR